jgi:CheY-like chemotaxis protein
VLARDWKGGINIEVWDSGIGIPESELPKIFGEFYQVANPERDRNKGLGIGLAIVSRLTLLLGHRLSVQSRVGVGSLFRIWIKGSDLEEMDEFTVGSETVPTRIDDTRTILFLDDEEAIRASVGEQLRAWGYTVLAVATMEEARRAVLDHDSTIDIVLSDLRLRGGEDGIRAISQIRELCGYTVPAILVTGDTEPAQVQRPDLSPLKPPRLPELQRASRAARTPWMSTCRRQRWSSPPIWTRKRAPQRVRRACPRPLLRRARTP